MSPLINFKNKSPSHRKKKELVALLLIGASLVSVLFYYNYFIHSPLIQSDLPSINIVSQEDINRDSYVDCQFELFSEDPDDSVALMNARIKFRGHTNAKPKIPKKGYRIELTEEKSLLGLNKDDDWHLLAMYFDFPRMRIKASFELWNSLKDINPTAVLPDTKYVRLFINGEFMGLYLLMERIDQGLFDLDDAQNNNDSSLIFQDKTISDFRKYDNGAWQQDWPNEDDGIYIMDEIMTNLFSFVNDTSDKDFFDTETGIYTKFDKLNLIDFFLFNFFINHKDFWDVNYYIVRNSNPNKFYLIPWDFDGSFGQRGWIIFKHDENPTSKIYLTNELYNRLLNNQEFAINLKMRWKYLRNNLWTEEFIENIIYEIYEDNKEFIEIDTTMWKPITVKDKSLVYSRYLYSTKEFDLNEYINNLFEFIPKRLDFCDSYFAE